MLRKLMFLPFLLLILVACQGEENLENATEEEQVENEAENKMENENNEEDPVENEEEADLTLYDDVLEEYAEFTELSSAELEDYSGEYVKDGAYLYFDKNLDVDYEGISVSYYDVTDNGVDELMISLRIDDEAFDLIDLYTIHDGELVSLFTDELSEKVENLRGVYSLIDNGKLVYYVMVGQGEEAGSIYEIDEDTMEYVEVYSGFTEEGDYEPIEEELENKIEWKNLTWEAVEEEKNLSVYEQFLEDDLSEFEGVWKNDYESVMIYDGKIKYESGNQMDVEYNEDNWTEDSQQFNLVGEDGVGGAALIFFPAGSEVQLSEEESPTPSDVDEHKFYIGQDGFPEEDEIYYKMSD